MTGHQEVSKWVNRYTIYMTNIPIPVGPGALEASWKVTDWVQRPQTTPHTIPQNPNCRQVTRRSLNGSTHIPIPVYPPALEASWKVSDWVQRP